jgi:hypothetical protein
MMEASLDQVHQHGTSSAEQLHPALRSSMSPDLRGWCLAARVLFLPFQESGHLSIYGKDRVGRGDFEFPRS